MSTGAYEKTALGKRIADYRKLRGFKNAQALADAISDERVSRSTIVNLELGRKKDATTTELMLIAKALRVSPVSLLVDLSKPFDRELEGLTNFETLNWFGLWEAPLASNVFDSDELDADVAWILRSLVQNSNRARALPLERASQIFGLGGKEVGGGEERRLIEDVEMFARIRKYLVADVEEWDIEVPPSFAPVPPVGQVIADAKRALADNWETRPHLQPPIAELRSNDG